MSARTRLNPSGPLRLAALLAAVAGFVDAHIYLNVVNVFVANQSGNMIHLGIFAGDFNWDMAQGSLVAILGFLTGVLIATTYHSRRQRLGFAIRPHILIWLEAVLIFLTALGLMRYHHGFSEVPNAKDLTFVALGAVSMGIQTTALRRVGAVTVATTYGTGTIVRIGEKVVDQLSVRGLPTQLPTRLRSVPIIILFTVLVAYVGGAALASWLGSQHWLLLAPVLPLTVAGAALRPVKAIELPRHSESAP